MSLALSEKTAEISQDPIAIAPAVNVGPKPLCVDLFCGYGGWARGFLDAGYRVIGFDNERKCAARYPGEFVLADVNNLDGTRFRKPRVIVASPPCTEFSFARSLAKRWGYERDPEKGMELVNEALRVIYEAEPTYWCLENVAGAVKAIGSPRARNGPQMLWGWFPGFIVGPTKKGVGMVGRKWVESQERWVPNPLFGTKGPRDSRFRALIPYRLARALAEACL